jgi:predicted RNA polymerase sigma factor
MSAAVALLLLTTWVRYGGVMAAGRHFRAGRRDAAWKELCRVPLHGRLLVRGVRPYFHLLRAAILLDRSQWTVVIEECEAVLAIEKTKAANHATAHGAMAKALAMLDRKDEAREHLRRARAMPHKPALDALLGKVAATLGEGEPTRAET